MKKKKRKKRYTLTVIKFKKKKDKILFTLDSNNRQYLFVLASVLGEEFGCFVDDWNIKDDCPQIWSNC